MGEVNICCTSHVVNGVLFCIRSTYLFLAALGLHCCEQAFSSCGKQGLLFMWGSGFSLQGLLVAKPRLKGAGISSCKGSVFAVQGSVLAAQEP